jgi:hypothetical protein
MTRTPYSPLAEIFITATSPPQNPTSPVGFILPAGIGAVQRSAAAVLAAFIEE